MGVDFWLLTVPPAILRDVTDVHLRASTITRSTPALQRIKEPSPKPVSMPNFAKELRPSAHEGQCERGSAIDALQFLGRKHTNRHGMKDFISEEQKVLRFKREKKGQSALAEQQDIKHRPWGPPGKIQFCSLFYPQTSTKSRARQERGGGRREVEPMEFSCQTSKIFILCQTSEIFCENHAKKRASIHRPKLVRFPRSGQTAKF